MTTPARNYPLAATFALLAFSGWTLSDVFLKSIRSEGVPQGQILLIGSVAGMAVIFLYCGARGNIRRLQARRWRPLLALGIAQWVSFACWLVALPRLPLANLYVFTFMTPMVVAGLAALILKEHLGWKRGIAIAAGFLGILIAVDPAKIVNMEGSLISYLALVGSVAGSAAQMLILRVVSQKESSECTAFYPRVILFLSGAVSCAVYGFTAMSARAFLFAAAGGALGALGWALVARAYKNATAAAVAPFQYSQMVTGALLGYFIWHDVPSVYLVAGSAVIIASGIYLVRHERRLSRKITRVDEASYN